MDLRSRLETLSGQVGRLAQELESLRAELADAPPPPPGGDSQFPAVAAFLALGPSLQEDALLHTILQCAMHATGARGAGLTLFEPDKQRLVFKAAIGDGADGILGYEIPLEGSQHGLAFATGEIQASAPLHKDIESRAGTAFRSVLVAPLMADGEPLGTISAVNKQGDQQFTVQDMQAYREFSELAALVVRQRMRENLLKGLIAGAAVVAPAELASWALSEQERRLMRVFDQLSGWARQSAESLALVERIIGSICAEPAAAPRP
jgi:GAF domain-containing protein